MENKCNKAQNCNNKFLDHVYCHSNASENKSYMRVNNSNTGNSNAGTSATTSDIVALLKENKQLKSMLLLHLDLIQEQSGQIKIKDKHISNYREDVERLRLKSNQLEIQILELQKQLQRYIKRNVAAIGEISTISPPPLAKIQYRSGNLTKKNNIIGECNGKLISKIILHRVSLPHSPSPDTDETLNLVKNLENVAYEEKVYNTLRNENKEKNVGIVLESVEMESSGSEMSNDAVNSVVETNNNLRTSNNKLNFSSSDNEKVSMIPSLSHRETPLQVCVTQPSRGKQMPLMLWHAPQIQSDESVSCDSVTDAEQCSSSLTPPITSKISEIETQHVKSSSDPIDESGGPSQFSNFNSHHDKNRKNAFISTSENYNSREWQDEEFLLPDYEFIKEEVDALQSDVPMLEIPKWTEHELTALYSIEGTEDLSDSTFSRRHSKLEIDEKRRKKWDYQQIREQRRIEKLKKRHCKNEIQILSEQQTHLSFYPQPDSVETICFMKNLPVQAFGEVIPKLSTNIPFTLPWFNDKHQECETKDGNIHLTNKKCRTTVETLISSTTAPSSGHAQHQVINSSFVFLKKRRRQQSSTGVGPISSVRRRSITISKSSTTNLIGTSECEH